MAMRRWKRGSECALGRLLALHLARRQESAVGLTRKGERQRAGARRSATVDLPQNDTDREPRNEHSCCLLLMRICRYDEQAFYYSQIRAPVSDTLAVMPPDRVSRLVFAASRAFALSRSFCCAFERSFSRARLCAARRASRSCSAASLEAFSAAARAAFCLCFLETSVKPGMLRLAEAGDDAVGVDEPDIRMVEEAGSVVAVHRVKFSAAHA